MRKRPFLTGRLLTLIAAMSAGVGGMCSAEPVSPASPSGGPKGERSVVDRPRAEAVFGRIDRDQDGVISKEEFVAAFDKFRHQARERAAALTWSGKGDPGWRGRPDHRRDRSGNGPSRRVRPPCGGEYGRPGGPPDGPPWAHGSHRGGGDCPYCGARPRGDRSRFHASDGRFGAPPYARYATRGPWDRAAGHPPAGPPWAHGRLARPVGLDMPARQRPSAADMMVRFDKNDDGKLTEDEVPEGPWARMSRADADEDGVVSAKELKTAVQKMRRQSATPGGGRGGRPDSSADGPNGLGKPRMDPKRVDAIFQRLDNNQDGNLANDEVPEGLWDRIARADANRDGVVSKKELKRLSMIGPPGGRSKRGAGGRLRSDRSASPAKDRPDKEEGNESNAKETE